MKNNSEPQPLEYKGLIEREFTLLNSEKGEEHEKDQAQSNTPSISLSDFHDRLISDIKKYNENQPSSEDDVDDDK